MSALLFSASESESDETGNSQNCSARLGDGERGETGDIRDGNTVNDGGGCWLPIHRIGLDNEQRTGVSGKKTVGSAGRTKVKLHHVTNATSFGAAADERGWRIGRAVTEETDIGQKAAEPADVELAHSVGAAWGKDNLIGKS